MNTANKLTLTRVVMIPIFLVVLYLDFAFNKYIALAIFILASITDFIDGYVARHYNQITDFGKFMDPLADKLLVVHHGLYLPDAPAHPGGAQCRLRGADRGYHGLFRGGVFYQKP